MFRSLVFLSIFALIFWGCKARRHHHICTGIYYWKTSFSPTLYERKSWDSSGIQDIYLHCFDVVLDAPTGRLIPVGIIRNVDNVKRPIIPVVFITQDAARSLTSEKVPELAANINKLLESLLNGQTLVNEVQMDCDWTSSSQDAYFAFLRALRKQPFFANKKLSCTIRMHQVKYRLRSGIPPVDRGLLMCYNMGDLKQISAPNSIIDNNIAQDYLKDLKSYPLPLDVALPIYSWSLQFRQGRFMGILRDVAPELVRSAASLFIEKKKNNFSAQKDTVFQGYSIHAGDGIRVEESNIEAVQEMAEFTAANIRNDSLAVLLFHSDSLSLKKHPAHALQAIFDAYR